MKHYKNDGNLITITYPNYNSLSRLFEWLNDIAQVTQLNEIGQFICSDDCGNLFEFNNKHEIQLQRNGFVVLEYNGETINDYKKSHPKVYNWFWNIKTT